MTDRTGVAFALAVAPAPAADRRSGKCARQGCAQPVSMRATWSQPHFLNWRPPTFERMLLCQQHGTEFAVTHNLDPASLAIGAAA